MKAEGRVGQRPSVSVIVLNYNGADLLPECLGSLLAQDRPAQETLVVDNGSLDDSAAVIARYPVRFLPQGANYGFSVANNRGAAAERLGTVMPIRTRRGLGLFVREVLRAVGARLRRGMGRGGPRGHRQEGRP